MKKFFISLPDDVRQTFFSLAVALALICSSLFMLSAYIGGISEKENSVQVIAPPPIEESTESTAP